MPKSYKIVAIVLLLMLVVSYALAQDAFIYLRPYRTDIGATYADSITVVIGRPPNVTGLVKYHIWTKTAGGGEYSLLTSTYDDSLTFSATEAANYYVKVQTETVSYLGGRKTVVLQDFEEAPERNIDINSYLNYFFDTSTGLLRAGVISADSIGAGIITTSNLNFVPLFSSGSDTLAIIATINASSEGIDIDADNLRIGANTYFESGYDPSDKAYADSVSALINRLGLAAYEDSIQAAMLGSTIIVGGFINTDLLTADNIVSGTFTGLTYITSRDNYIKIGSQDNILSGQDAATIEMWRDGVSSGPVGLLVDNYPTVYAEPRLTLESTNGGSILLGKGDDALDFTPDRYSLLADGQLSIYQDATQESSPGVYIKFPGNLASGHVQLILSGISDATGIPVVNIGMVDSIGVIETKSETGALQIQLGSTAYGATVWARDGFSTLASDVVVDNFSTDATMADSSTTTVPTESAIKAYVSAHTLNSALHVPSQSGATGKYLKSDGSVATWETVSGSAMTAAEILDSLLTVDGVGSGLNADLLDNASSAYFATASSVSAINDTLGTMTATGLLTRIKSVDGAGSGLDADLLDGNSSAAFAAASHNQAWSTITSTPTTISGYGITDGLTDGDFASAGFMKTNGSGTYSIASDGTDTDITVVVDVRLYYDATWILEKKTTTIHLTDGQVTGYTGPSAWTDATGL